MFTMAKIKDRSSEIVNGGGHKSNYLDSHLIHNDYYSENEKVQGEWTGELSERLGLLGKKLEAGDSAFEKLRKNINPKDNSKLTPRTVKGGVRFFDFQCSAQKSVSIMAITMNDDRLRNAHKESVKIALKELEKFAACRIRKGDNVNTIKRENTGNICTAVFNHDASRSLDPQLHTHNVVANATWDEKEQRIVALESIEMIKAIRYAGKVYQSTMAVKVKNLGYDIVNKINKKGQVEGFEIKGVSKEVQQLYSKRRSEIEIEINKFEKEKGRYPTTQEIHVITKETRNYKLDEITTKEVIKNQLSQLSDKQLIELSTIKNNALNHSYIIDPKEKNKCISESINFSKEHCFERESVVSGHKILAECLNHGLGKFDIEDIKNVLEESDQFINLDKDVENVLSNNHTTQTSIELEKTIIETIDTNKNIFDPINAEFQPFSDKKSKQLEIEKNYNFETQKKVIIDLLSSSDRFMSLRGLAGTGKTTLLEQLDKGMKEGNLKNIIYLAPTRDAVNELKREGFSNATTVASYLMNPESIKAQMIIVDESSLISNKAGAKLIESAIEKDARIIFVGDTRQHKSVEAGDFSRLLETHSQIQITTLDNINRQQNLTYRKAISFIANGDSTRGLDILDNKLRWVKEANPETDKNIKYNQYLTNAANDYLYFTDNGTNLNKCIAVAPTHRECDEITNQIREKLKENKVIGKFDIQKEVFQSYNWTAAQKRSLKSYQEGQSIILRNNINEFKKNEIWTVVSTENMKLIISRDGKEQELSVRKNYKDFDIGEINKIELSKSDIIMLRQNANKHSLTNGDLLTIKNIHKDGTIIVVDKNGAERLIPEDYIDFKHGYVTTSHKSQGKTKTNVVVAAKNMDQVAAYVASSRGKQELRIHVPDREKLYEQAAENSYRRSAHDLLNKENTLSENKHIDYLKEFSNEQRPIVKAHMATMIQLHIKQYSTALKEVDISLKEVQQHAKHYRYIKSLQNFSKKDKEISRMIGLYDAKQLEFGYAWKKFKDAEKQPTPSLDKISQFKSEAILLSHQRNKIAFQLSSFMTNDSPFSILKENTGKNYDQKEHEKYNVRIQEQATEYKNWKTVQKYISETNSSKKAKLADQILNNKATHKHVTLNKLSWNKLKTNQEVFKREKGEKLEQSLSM